MKYDGMKKGPGTISLLATDPNIDLSQGPRIEEEADVFKIREPGRTNLAKPPMDVHRMSSPIVEIASQQGEVGDSKEMASPQEEKPCKEAL